MTFRIEADWVDGDASSSTDPERQAESACLARIGMWTSSGCLTEARRNAPDHAGYQVFEKPLLPGYYLARWLAWNWWRLLFEPPHNTSMWRQSHQMAAIGGGYVWPNVTFRSDGVRVHVKARPSQKASWHPFWYTSHDDAIIGREYIEKEFENFIQDAIDNLNKKNIHKAILCDIWSELRGEFGNEQLAEYRRFEARLGFDPDEASENVVDRLIADAADYGEETIGDVASAFPGGADVPSVADLRATARRDGIPGNPRDAITLDNATVQNIRNDSRPWRRGYLAARAVWEQIPEQKPPISTDRLCELAGVSPTLRDNTEFHPYLAYALDVSDQEQHVVLHASHQDNRRFELARLIGDRLVGGRDGRLFPATKALTYRQKLQRAFAAELLCPVQYLDNRLGDDRSVEAQSEIAEELDVSSWVVNLQLKNHGLIGDDEIDPEIKADRIIDKRAA